MDEKLRAQFEMIKKEREDFGSIVKVKRTCTAEVNRYIGRLKRRKEAVTNAIDRLPTHGDELIAQVAELKAKREILNTIIAEFEKAEEHSERLGAQAAQLQVAMKKTAKQGHKVFESVPPDK